MADEQARQPSWRQGATWAIAALVLAGMYWDVGAYFAQRWLQEDTYHHCLFVPPVVGWLIWRRRETLSQLTPRADWRGLFVLGGGALLYVVAMRVGVRVAIGFSFPIVLAGLVWTGLGLGFLRHLLYPLILLLFVVPVPKHIMGHFGMPLQVTSAAGAARIAHLLGLPVIHDGINLTLNGHTYVIAEQCSGLNSLLALLFAAAVLVEVMNVRAAGRFILLTAPAVVLAGNVVRLVSVLIFAEFAGPQFAMDSLVHGGSDIIVYLAAFSFMWLLIDLVSERRMVAIILGRESHRKE
ncbi:MAG: exosortase/archaeosortase family protein, partial [Armatimonadota bacterium]